MGREDEWFSECLAVLMHWCLNGLLESGWL